MFFFGENFFYETLFSRWQKNSVFHFHLLSKLACTVFSFLIFVFFTSLVTIIYRKLAMEGNFWCLITKLPQQNLQEIAPWPSFIDIFRIFGKIFDPVRYHKYHPLWPAFTFPRYCMHRFGHNRNFDSKFQVLQTSQLQHLSRLLGYAVSVNLLYHVERIDLLCLQLIVGSAWQRPRQHHLFRQLTK